MISLPAWGVVEICKFATLSAHDFPARVGCWLSVLFLSIILSIKKLEKQKAPPVMVGALVYLLLNYYRITTDLLQGRIY